MTSVLAWVPNERPRLVKLSPDDLVMPSDASCELSVASILRRALRNAFVLGDDLKDDAFRVLYQDRDVEGIRSAEAFADAFTSSAGIPVMIRLAFRLLGGKGGFGALLKKQAAGAKKTTNFDSMRDLSGRRVRHAKAVERIKGWMEKKKQEDELVDLITGEGPDLPKAPKESDSLDPSYVNRLKRGAAQSAAAVGQGMRRAFAEDGEENPAVDGGAAKRLRMDPAMLANVTGAASSSSSSRGTAPRASTPSMYGALDALGGLSSGSEGGQSEEEGKAGDETMGIDEEAVPVANPRQSTNSPATSEDEAETAGNDARPSADSPRKGEDAACGNAKQNQSVPASAAAPVVKASPEPPPVALKLIAASDLSSFKSAASLEADVSPEALKQSLMALGLKCGGTPRERAERLFLLKDKRIEDLPKSVKAPAKK